MLKKIIVITLFCFGYTLNAQVWQWSVEVENFVSKETDANPEAYIWIPENCKQVKGVVFGQHNMLEETIFNHIDFRKKMAKIDFAIVWVTPGFSQTFDVSKNHDKIFNQILNDLSVKSGYEELAFVPIVPLGHSAMATFPWNFAAFNPKRTLALVSVHGDAPQTTLTGYGRPNIDWNNRNIDGIPALFLMGEYEWWEDRIVPGYNYVAKHPKSVITFLADAGHGHFDASDITINYIADYIIKSAKERLPKKINNNKLTKLKPVKPNSGWLMDKWRKDSLPKYKAASFSKFKGNKKVASWVFDEEMAKNTEKFYAKARGKNNQHLGFIQEGKILKPYNNHKNYNLIFKPLDDGLSFHLKAFFSDSTKVKYAYKHAKTTLQIDKICGPVEKVNDTTFKISFDKLGFNNKKRSNVIWLLAHNQGDDTYKSTVQQLELKFPLRNENGAFQQINFQPIQNQKMGVKSIKLSATSSKGFPVNFYVKEGPAFIKNNKLILTKIPPKSKLPIKITVVAWQYGIANKLQSAKPVNQHFYITK